MTLKAKHESLQTILRDLGRVVVAYSGGVDSSYLLKAAADTLGARNVLACISMGPSEPGNICEKAHDIARDIGVELMVVEAGELEDPNFAANNADRCFHCKSHLCRTLLDVAKQRGFPHVIFGTNFDDLDDYRPGNQATKVFGVRSPLAEAGLTKDEIRQLSREAGLPTADQPASPCLASRIPYGLEVTEQRLRQIDQAEDVLRSLGFVECRVRHHDTIARIEVRPHDIQRLIAEPVRSKVIEALKALGFRFVTTDLQGFRSGSLNESLSDEQKKAGLQA
jgi:pyridinium-3,5-biscarboxylic acid mononucleotide sulfurtransferase